MLTLSLMYTISSVAPGASAHAADRAAPIEIARSPGASCDLRTDAQFIYWTTSDNGLAQGPSSLRAHGQALEWPRASSTILRAPIEGGVVTRLTTVKGNWAFLLSLDRDHLYWNGLRTGEIWRMPKAGGAPVRVDDGAHKLMGTATDATYVYASDRSARPEGLLRIPKAGGAATLVAQSRALTLVLGVDQGDLYWAERLDGGTGNGWLLRTVATSGGKSRTLAQLDALPGKGVFSDDIYFIAGSTAYGMSRRTGALRRLARASEYGDRGAIAVDSRYLYWGEGKTGELKRVPKSGGAASVVAIGKEPCGVVVNGETIFWMDRGGYRLMRMTIRDD